MVLAALRSVRHSRRPHAFMVAGAFPDMRGPGPDRMMRCRTAIRLPISSTDWRTCRARRNPLVVRDHHEPVGGVDHGDQGDQRGDLVVVVVLAHLGPGLVGHTVIGVGESGAFLGERERGPLGLGEYGGMAPGGDQVEPERGLAGGRGLLGVDVDAPTAAVDLVGAQHHQLLGGLGQRRLLDRQADVEDLFADLGADLVPDQVDTGFHDFVLCSGVGGRADRSCGVLTNMEMPATRSL
jgi:hypothetical protein